MGIQLPTYPMGPPPGWCLPFIGLTYEEGARGPDAYDCWGIMLLVLREQFGITLPRYEGVHWGPGSKADRDRTASVISTERMLWEAVEPGKEQPGDCIVLNIAARPLHVGVVAAPGWMIHGTEGSNSALERYDGMMWRNRVDGFYRYRGAA